MESIDPERCVHFEKEMLTTLIEKLQDTSKLLQHFITSGQIEAGFGQMCSKDIESAISSIGTEGSELRFNELALGIACVRMSSSPSMLYHSDMETTDLQGIMSSLEPRVTRREPSKTTVCHDSFFSNYNGSFRV